MKLVFAKEMQSLDQQSAEQIGLPTMVLMENAGKAVAETAADFLEDCFGKRFFLYHRGRNLQEMLLRSCVFAGSVVLNYLHLRKTEAAGM